MYPSTPVVCFLLSFGPNNLYCITVLTGVEYEK